MSTIIGLTGILCAVIGLVIVLSFDFCDKDSLVAAVALGLGIVGGFLWAVVVLSEVNRYGGLDRNSRLY